MNDITVRNLPPSIAAALEKEMRNRGKSLNQTSMIQTSMIESSGEWDPWCLPPE